MEARTQRVRHHLRRPHASRRRPLENEPPLTPFIGHTPVNPDLAAGRARVVILAPTTGGVGAVPSVGEQMAALRAAGSVVVVVSPDRDARSQMGRNVVDSAKRAVAAQAGHRQATPELDRVAALWR